MINDQPRMILALAHEADDEFIWNRIKTLESQIFAGPVSVKLAFFGRETASQTRRPCITTNWVTDAADWADLVDRGRAGCICGCFIQTGDILEQALRETQQAPVQAVVIVSDSFHGNLDAAVATAKQLRAAGTRVFLFQQGRSGATEHAFRILAEVTGGAYHRFNPHVERVAERLPEMLEVVSHFATGGMQALEARGGESAALLLEQMSAADQNAR
jgi:hypothetical protein